MKRCVDVAVGIHAAFDVAVIICAKVVLILIKMI